MVLEKPGTVQAEALQKQVAATPAGPGRRRMPSDSPRLQVLTSARGYPSQKGRFLSRTGRESTKGIVANPIVRRSSINAR